MKILKPNSENLKKCAEALQAGELVAFPTETVYGLGANALNEAACLKIFAAKGRPADNPLIVHLSEASEAEHYAVLPDGAIWRAIKKYWPGPLTVILKDRGVVAPVVTAGTGKIGLRVPDLGVARELIRLAGVPLAAPSANKSGRPSPTRAEHVAEDFEVEEVAAVIDGGAAVHGLESTILDLSGKTPLLVRQGAISFEELAEDFPDLEIADEFKEGMTVSPGLKYRHYAPKAPLEVFTGSLAAMRTKILNKLERGKKAVIICTEENSKFYPLKNTLVLADYNNPETAAKSFYHSLRVADQQKPEVIYCETFANTGIGSALFKRMQKAASRLD